MQSLSRYQLAEEQRAARARHNALLTKLAGDRMIAALDRLGEVLAKGGYDPEQPRLPEGVTGGGRWSDGSGQQPAAIPLLSDFLAVFPDAIAGAAGGLELPALSSPPVIPLNKPASAEHVTAVVRGSAEWLQSAKETGKSTQGRAFFNQLLDASWLRSHMPRIVSYLQDPKTEEELQDAVSSPKAGFATHHRNERAAALAAGYPKPMVNGRLNLMHVPEIRHWDVTGWYMRKNDDYGGLSPRQYLADKNWNTRTQIGNRALRLHGILKP